ncbi:hypothetical protein J7E88_08540 [Streptomyces sp. ISL-10]|uniref:hypothetical protein n=1 Tax=Streptomyces sp. ISL-10 TaxID=2819172 RepID=UPI001BEAA281|nr:hypothetical protein [Streptomyces sp. ISL-10]MBT2365370.1 hypothetical protein [Streptomyces sp. ISL-10]
MTPPFLARERTSCSRQRGLSAYVAAGPVTILTSDPEDLTTLCAGRVTVIKVWRQALGS